MLNAAWVLAATCTAAALPGLATQHTRVLREAARFQSSRALDPSLQAAQAARAVDFCRVASRILGVEACGARTDGRPTLVGADLALAADLPCDGPVKARDHVAWSMGLAGYSTRDIADVVGGHLTRADLDEARALLMAGRPRSLVAALVEARWREPAPASATAVRVAEAAPPERALPTAWESELLVLARRHQIEPDLIRAVVAAESGGNPRAVSPAGAIGLMQLMPPTAAALGVDPWQPVENLTGGVAYLAGLLRAYAGNLTLALIAYNAGPQHADRVRAGLARPYRETRRYLDAVAARYPLP